MRWFVFGPQYDPIASFDTDEDAAALAPFVADQDAVDPDLRDFEERGGKLLIYNGWADHSTPPARAIQYYEEVERVHGERTRDFTRLFMLPGYHHCSGGPGPNNFGAAGHHLLDLHDPERDVMGAIVAWVERADAPERLIGTRYIGNDPERGVERTRPFCPYPQLARYDGSGSIDDAGNFVCADPLD
jgi:feruloyl esterase